MAKNCKKIQTPKFLVIQKLVSKMLRNLSLKQSKSRGTWEILLGIKKVKSHSLSLKPLYSKKILMDTNKGFA